MSPASTSAPRGDEGFDLPFAMQGLWDDPLVTLKQRFGSHPEDFYWGNADTHNDFKGLEEFSKAVAAFMALVLINPNQSSLHP